MSDVYSDIGFAKLDLSRKERTGQPETIYCAGKSKEQLLKILQTFQKYYRARYPLLSGTI